MNLQTLTFLGLTALLSGCGDQAPPQATLSTVAPTELRAELRAGDVHRYAFDWKVQAEGDAAMVGGASVRGDVRLVGELAITVYQAGPGDALLGIRFARLDEHRVGVMGHNVLPSAELLTGSEAMLMVPRDGQAQTLQFAPDATPIFRKLMEGTMAHIDLRVPPEGESEFDALGPTGNGLARLHYEPDPTNPGKMTRSVVDYVRIDALPGVPVDAPWAVDAQGVITRGQDALVETIEVAESLSVVGKESPVVFGSETSFVMTRLGVDREEPRAVPNTDDWLTRDLHEAPDMESVEREMSRKFAEGLTVTDVIINVQSAGRGLPPPKGFMIRARGLLRGWPELAAELKPLFEDTEDITTRELVVDLLVSAGTEEAQDVLLDVLAEPTSATVRQLPTLIQHLSLLRTPTADVSRFLLGLHDANLEDGNSQLALGVLYPMGSVAAQIGAREPELAERMLVAMRDALETSGTPQRTRAALAGLGNARRPEDLDRVLAQRAHSDPGVRIQVASSLRFSDDRRSTDALFAFLFDADREVATASLSVLEAYRTDEAQLHELAAQVIGGTVNPEIHGPLVSTLAKRGLEDDLAREALAILHSLATDGRDRVRIERILGGST